MNGGSLQGAKTVERRTDREEATRKKERWKGRGYGMSKERGAELNQKDDDK